MAKYGWRPVCIGIGLTSPAWMPAWIQWAPRGGAMQCTLVLTPGFADILRQRSFWGMPIDATIWPCVQGDARSGELVACLFHRIGFNSMQSFTWYFIVIHAIRPILAAFCSAFSHRLCSVR